MPRRSRTQLEKDRAATAEMYLRGYTQAEIAERLNVTQVTISNDLAAIREKWQASAIRDFDEMRAQELAKIDQLEITYWRAWEQSCEEYKTQTVRENDGGDRQITRKIESRVGDPRFLTGVQQCIERRCKLLGLDDPQNINLTGDISHREIIELDNEQFDMLYAAFIDECDG